MNVVKIVLVIVFVASIMSWARDGEPGVHPAKLLPFLHGEATKYDVAGIILSGLFLWGLARLLLSRRK